MNRFISIGRRVRSWSVHLTIACYLGVLAFGIFSHTFNYKKGNHPAMYYVIWDMFCGWSAYDFRVHILGEGESGTIYELAPGPWGQVCPYGELARQHYDTFCNAIYRQAMNTLDHSAHEPMTRIFCVEESWAKKYNLPDAIWKKRYPEEKDLYSYYHLRAIIDVEGNNLHRNTNWYSYHMTNFMMDNPRLVGDSHRYQPFAINSASSGQPTFMSGRSNYQSTQSLAVGAPLGN
ncbi:MAG: hypothetical protein WD065_17145 [Planctomycetaceae bacterium]